MNLGELISKYYKDKTPIKVVPKYGEALGSYQNGGKGFIVNDYDSKTGFIELLKTNNVGKEIKVYIHLRDIPQIIDDSQLWN